MSGTLTMALRAKRQPSYLPRIRSGVIREPSRFIATWYRSNARIRALSEQNHGVGMS